MPGSLVAPTKNVGPSQDDNVAGFSAFSHGRKRRAKLLEENIGSRWVATWDLLRTQLPTADCQLLTSDGSSAIAFIVARCGLLTNPALRDMLTGRDHISLHLSGLSRPKKIFMEVP